jgi:hypothetical protein
MALELLITDEAVCLDKQPGEPGAKVVSCTSDKAAFQLVGKGSPISKADADRFGVKTKNAETSRVTLKVDSHTIARTPEEKAFALTQPQPQLTAARAENMRSAANLAIASMAAEDQAKSAEADEEAKKEDEAANKKLKTKTENKSATKTPRKARAKKSTKKEEAAKPATP